MNSSTGKSDVQLTELLNSSRDILSAAYARGLCLRLVGSIGIAQRCYRQIDYARLPLRRWKDIDLVCRQYDYAGVRSLLISRGFAVDLTIEVATEGRRAFFEGKRFSVDLFVDELEFCHRLPLKQRLSVDPVTIPAADLLLSKLQRVQLRDSDWVDIFLLLGTFALGCKDGITLNSRRLEEVLCSDWGFYYTAICNLKLCTVRLPELLMGNYISAELLDHALLMAGRIVSIIETAPKTIGWKLRSLVGTRLAWYKTVDSPETF